jgi:hypothetical protein
VSSAEQLLFVVQACFLFYGDCMSDLQFLPVSDILSTVGRDADNKQQLCPAEGWVLVFVVGWLVFSDV